MLARAGKVGHFEASCETKKKKEGTPNHASSQFCGSICGKPKYGRMARNPRGSVMYV